MSLKTKLLLFLYSALSVTGCTYERKANASKHLCSGCFNPSKKQIAFFRAYGIFRRATGIAAFPDGGIPKYLYKNVSIYVLDIETGKVRKIVDLGEDTYDGWPSRWKMRISWRKNKIVYWTSYLSWDKDKGAFMDNKGIFILDADGNNNNLLVGDGEMPDISPDAQRVVYQKVNKTWEYELWVIDVDGTNNRMIKKIPDLKLVYTRWKKDGMNVLLYEFEQHSQVYELSLETKEIKKTESPYLKNYGNVSVPPEYTKGITDEEWGVPSPPEKIIWPF